MKSLAIALALAVALPVAAKDKPFERPVQVRVDVSAEGRVVAADAVGDLPESLARIAEAAVKDVEFEPAQVNGQPASSRTTLDVKMRFTPESDDSVSAEALAIEASKPMFHPPRYPMRAAQRGYGARVVMKMQLTADGRVDVERSGLHDISLWHGGRKLERSQAHRDEFVAEVMKVMEHWRPVIEEVDGAPVSTVWRVPVTFCPPGRARLCDQIKADATQSASRTADTDGIRLASLKAPVGGASGS
ncbi:hypothetical protein [Arenimonas donghaensis]|uniref:TonB C-terminal domain-containing protein n=1 Tax=Arenimonas donghaensis DSM 18148 = HO3-R19 TaxID=1121014 RepID=A0A087MJS9_9GAMM|nr:hypothetical protein [Arenimonas donghaensis]KFL37132.1 hypothetical protein N788_11440 [Arenimonas donghaensis DSM 18148 = HO3-R19]